MIEGPSLSLAPFISPHLILHRELRAIMDLCDRISRSSLYQHRVWETDCRALVLKSGPWHRPKNLDIAGAGTIRYHARQHWFDRPLLPVGRLLLLKRPAHSRG